MQRHSKIFEYVPQFSDVASIISHSQSQNVLNTIWLMVIRPFQITLASTRPYSVLWRIGCMVCWRKSLWFLIQFKTCVKYHSGWKKDKTHIKPHKWMDMTYNNNYILIDRNQKSSDDQVSCCFSHHVKTNSRQFAWQVYLWVCWIPPHLWKPYFVISNCFEKWRTHKNCGVKRLSLMRETNSQ